MTLLLLPLLLLPRAGNPQVLCICIGERPMSISFRLGGVPRFSRRGWGSPTKLVLILYKYTKNIHTNSFSIDKAERDKEPGVGRLFTQSPQNGAAAPFCGERSLLESNPTELVGFGPFQIAGSPTQARDWAHFSFSQPVISSLAGMAIEGLLPVCRIDSFQLRAARRGYANSKSLKVVSCEKNQ